MSHPLLNHSHKYGREDSVARIAKRDMKRLAWVNANRPPAPIPTFDEEGYPTDETLDVISGWPITSNFASGDLLNYVSQAWRYDFISKRGGSGRKRWIGIATSGWSGNESIVRALENNAVFWCLCWFETRRGGGYKLLTSPIKEDAP